MNFDQFLNTYYLPSELKSLQTFLQSNGLFSEAEKIIDQFFINTRFPELESSIVQVVLTIRDFTVLANSFISQQSDLTSKEESQSHFIRLAVYLIKETYEISGLSKRQYFVILKSTLKKVYHAHGWNFDELTKILNLDVIEQYSSDKIEHKITGRSILTKAVSFIWLSKVHLDIFVTDFSNYFKVSKAKDVHLLFQSVIHEFEIKISPKRLHHLLVLFDTLHKKRTIKLSGSRGLFSHLENHFKPSEGTFPGMEFRKLKYGITNDLTQSSKIKRDIELTFGRFWSS